MPTHRSYAFMVAKLYVLTAFSLCVQLRAVGCAFDHVTTVGANYSDYVFGKSILAVKTQLEDSKEGVGGG